MHNIKLPEYPDFLKYSFRMYEYSLIYSSIFVKIVMHASLKGTLFRKLLEDVYSLENS